MSNDDIEVFFDKTDGGSYLESLMRSRLYVDRISSCKAEIRIKLEEVILLELDLAKLGAEKAKSEIIKSEKDNVRPIK